MGILSGRTTKHRCSKEQRRIFLFYLKTHIRVFLFCSVLYKKKKAVLHWLRYPWQQHSTLSLDPTINTQIHKNTLSHTDDMQWGTNKLCFICFSDFVSAKVFKHAAMNTKRDNVTANNNLQTPNKLQGCELLQMCCSQWAFWPLHPQGEWLTHCTNGKKVFIHQHHRWKNRVLGSVYFSV